MRVRLAFSVAAHLDSDILLVDEVLAVGDADFQRKCMGKMHDVAGEGRTVVFVSHNLSAVQRLCTRAILIESGRLEMDGAPGEVVARYLERWGPDQTGGTVLVRDDVPRIGTGDARIRRITLTDLVGRELTAVHLGQAFRVRLVVEVAEAIPEAVFEVGVSGADGERILTAQNIDGERPPASLRPGLHEVEAELRTTLLPGEYSLTAGVHRRNGVTADYIEQALGFSALNVAESGGDHYPWRGVRGYVRPDSEWSSPVPADDAPRTGVTA
jgi:lipopolysaccharide transport system ATP-binding protein